MTDIPTSTPQPENGAPLSEKILGRIKNEQPAPRWQFAARNLLFWLLWITSALLGALALAAALFSIMNAGWEFRELTHPGLIPFLAEKIPVLWLVALALATIVAYENLRLTERGYRYPLIAVVVGSVFVSGALAAAFYANGVGQRVEEGIGSHIPFHTNMLRQDRVRWTDPRRGMLAGEVVSVQPENNVFFLRGFDGAQWSVSLDDVSAHGRDVVERYPAVRVVGVPAPSSSDPFHACFVFPWTVRGTVDGKKIFVARMTGGANEFLQSEECQKLQPFRMLRTLEQKQQNIQPPFLR